MKIACISDIHSPQYFEDFVRVMENFKIKPDLFLMAGDIINRGRINEFEKIFNVLFGKIFCPIISCFGNNEYTQLRPSLRERYKEVIFLDDESFTLEISGLKIGIVGSTGCLDKPTTWQRRNVPEIERIYEQRLNLIDKLLSEVKADFKILLVHYSPTYKTLKGEREFAYPTLGCEKMEKVIIERRPNLVVHGHAHNGIKKAWIDTIPVFNAAFPVNKDILVIDTEEDLKAGITKFI